MAVIILVYASIVLIGLMVVRYITSIRDNAGRASAEADRRNEARFRSLVQHSSDVISIVDRSATFRYVSPSVTQVFGYTAGELEGTRFTALLHPSDVGRLEATIADGALGPGAVSPPTELRLRHRDGRWLTIEAVATNLVDEVTIGGIVINARDVSERKVLEAQLTHQAFHDPLTGLANRALFIDRVSHALERGQRLGDTIGVLFLDLDNFKTINDSLGHTAGDRLLVTASGRLQGCVRTSDTVARLGGDEFALLIERAVGEMSATTVAERITTALQTPFSIEGKEVFVAASIGIATAGGASGNDATAAMLLRNADMAMYTAKGRGKGRYEVFERHMHWEALDRLDLEADLRRAVERRELTVMYQPIVTLDDGTIAGAEALLRWMHPRRGILHPSQFISVAEEIGVIDEIGEWVLREACRHAAGWITTLGPAGTPFAIAVNVSGHQLQDPECVATVRAALEAAKLRPDSLVLEITESALMQGMHNVTERLTALKEVGVRLAIDDFGTGYSSLSYLQRFPIDILKIAKPFVDDLTIGTDGAAHPALARAIIALGQTLGLQTVAEGIEVRPQVEALRSLGCELGQGYLYSTPLTVEQMHHLILDLIVGQSHPQLRAGQPSRRSDGPRLRPPPTDPQRDRGGRARFQS